MSTPVQINITESASPKNAATIDKDGLIGNTFTKDEIKTEISNSFVGSIKGEATPSTVPTVYDPVTYPNGLYEKYDVKTAGTYTNFKNSSNVSIVITTEDLDKKEVQLWVQNGVSKKIINELPLITAQNTFDNTDEVNPPTMKAVGERYDTANKVLKYFTELESEITPVTEFLNDTYLRRDGTTFSSNGNKAVLNIDVTDVITLKYNCFPAVIISSLDSQYCSILAEKSDGTKTVLRTCTIINSEGGGQSLVDEEYDLTDFVKLSLSIGDTTVSSGQTPNIRLIKGVGSDGTDAVKIYIDQKTEQSVSVVNQKVQLYDNVLKYFIELTSDSVVVDDFLPNIYLGRNGTTLSSNGNKAILNIDVTGFDSLRYNCFPAVIVASLDNLYCSILAEKADGTKVVLRTCTIINNEGAGQSKVDEEYDLTDYVKLSLSIGDMAASLKQIPNILLFRSDSLDPENSVKLYIDEKTEGSSENVKIDLKGNISLNKIDSFTTNDVVLNGGATISSGLINCSGNSTVTVNENTLNENSEMSFIYQEVSASNTMAGFRSYNGFGYGHHVFVKYHTSGANNGKLEIIANTSLGYSQLSTTSNTNYSIGDIVRLGVARKGLKYTFFVQNFTKGWKLEMSQTVIPLGTPFVGHNSSSPQFVQNSGSVKILKYSHICFCLNIENASVGDSITYGQSATAESLRWASGVKGNNIVMGGGADVTASVLARVAEIIKIKPRRVLLMIGGNDILFNVASSVWQQNLKDIRNQLTNAGIEVVHCYPTPRAGAGQLITFLKNEQTFLLDFKIDTNTPLMNGNTETLKAEFDSGDHLHPSDLGMAEITKIVNAALIQM